ncbi:MAG: alpha/beta fold hydrolase [Gemmataceae bacterium]
MPLVVWIILGVFAAIALGLFAFHLYIFTRYIPFVIRGFQEKPLFIPPTGQPAPDAEDVDIPTTNGLTLKGAYFKARLLHQGGGSTRKGVILFGLEFGSNRWACVSYTDFLRDQGYDIFTFEMRGQGESPSHAGYDPLQWVTEFELDDFRAAARYLKARPDADPKGFGLFGISKGGSAGLLLAAEEPAIKCCATDGVFAAHTTMVPYMQRWIHIYTPRSWIANMLPHAYYAYAANYSLRKIAKARHCRFPSLERAMARLAPRPLLMIHGGGDNYIKPQMAQSLFDRARGPKEFWLVNKAKHNQALDLAGDEYRRRVLEFFDKHLAGPTAPAGPEVPAPDVPPAVECNGLGHREDAVSQWQKN